MAVFTCACRSAVIGMSESSQPVNPFRKAFAERRTRGSSLDHTSAPDTSLSSHVLRQHQSHSTFQKSSSLFVASNERQHILSKETAERDLQYKGR